jgi:hypothetical protein
MTTQTIQATSASSTSSAALDRGSDAVSTLEEPSTTMFGSLSAFDVVEQLANLILKTVGAERDNAKTQKKIDRDNQYRCEQAQVEAMRDKAGAIMDGAIASGVCSIASGACSVYDATRAAPQSTAVKNEPSDAAKPGKWQALPGAIATPLGGMASSAGKVFGDSPAAGHEASAKAAELAAQRAKDRASDDNDRLQELGSVAQEALGAIKTAQNTQNDMIQSILRRM